MRFGSLFTGVGGFDLGFERAGMECAWQVENDPHCNKVLERHWKNTRRYEDVRTVGKHNLEPVELICGGFPCQDLSVAGKRAGFAGERSSLWFEFERIIDELRPKWVVVENVPGLLSSAGGDDFAVILQSLDGFGYGVAWRVLDSQYFGVAQRRRRVFIVASLGSPRSGQVLFEQESVSGNFEKGKEKGEGTAIFTPAGFGDYSEGTGTLRSNGGDLGGGSESLIAYNMHQNDDKRPDRPNGGLYVKQSDKALTQGSKSKTIVMSSGQTNAEIDSERSPALTGLHEQPVVFQQNQRDEIRDMQDKAGALASEPGMHQQNFIAQSVGHSGGETLKFNKVVNTLNAQTGSETTAMFNGVWEPRSADGVPRIHEGDVSPTLNTMKGGQRQRRVGVRRLTPTECCRLQGFPDDWNDNVSDTQRYKQMGNAVTVNVIEWIGKRIKEKNEP